MPKHKRRREESSSHSVKKHKKHRKRSRSRSHSRSNSRSRSPEDSRRKRDRERSTREHSSRNTEVKVKPEPVTQSAEKKEDYDIVQQLQRIKTERAAKSKRKRWGDAPATTEKSNVDIQASLAKAKEVARLRMQIQQKMALLKKATPAVGGLSRPENWAPLRLDDQGRQVDEKGNVIKIDTSKVATLKVNKRPGATAPSAMQRQIRPVKTQHVDARMEMPELERKSRKLTFVKPGKYIRRAQTMRMKQLSKEMRAHRYESMSDSANRTQVLRVDPIPDVEWWDKFLLQTPDDGYSTGLDESKITHYIYNPVPADPVAEAPPPPAMALMLTEAEKKKIRRMRKQEKEKQRQDQVQFALIAADGPKLRLSNMHRAMGDDFISGPSSAEAKTRAQMAARKEAHEQHNASRALTPAQKADKRRKKLHEDTSREVHVCVFRTGDLYDGQRRFKIDINAQQYNMTGAVVLCGDVNIVAVEGGPKACKKFTRLMLHRIQWESDIIDKEAEESDEEVGSDDEEGERRHKSSWNKCVLVWQGILPRRKFKAFSFEHCRSEAMGRAHFESRGVSHYWDICKNYTDLADA